MMPSVDALPTLARAFPRGPEEKWARISEENTLPNVPKCLSDEILQILDLQPVFQKPRFVGI